MTDILSREQRIDMAETALKEGRISQGFWRDNGDDGREMVCALAAFAAMRQAPRCVSQNQPDDTQVVLCEAGETQDQQAPVPVNASDMIDQTTTDLYSTMYAVEWAREFLSMDFDQDDIDEGLMIGWFANAIMCGYDHATWKHEKEQQAPVSDDVRDMIERLEENDNALFLPLLGEAANLFKRLTQPQPDAAVAVERERERCAKVAETMGDKTWPLLLMFVPPSPQPSAQEARHET